MRRQPFLHSFKYAFAGLRYGLKTQRNLRFHAVAASAVLIASAGFGVTREEFWRLILAITLVVAAELINTAVELAVDLAMPEPHPKAKAAKDVAAAAVLITAVFALYTGLDVFGGYFLGLLRAD
jgi:diacylglycerol kinase